MLRASADGELRPDADPYIRGLIEAFRVVLDLPDTQAGGYEAAQRAWTWEKDHR